MKKAFSTARVALCLPLLLVGAPRISRFESSAPVHATAPPPPPIALVDAFLDLSPSQADQFQALLGPFLDTLRGLEAQKEARQQALEQLLDTPNPSPQDIVALVLQIHALGQQQAKAIEAFHQAFAGLLSYDQSQKVQAVTQAAQLAPVVAAFQALYLVPPEPSGPPGAPAP